MGRPIPLFYWSSKVFENKPKENYGDLLSKFIVEQASGRATIFYNAPQAKKKWFKKSYLMGIGSILKYATSKASVWGSGIIARDDHMGHASFYAVRGPLSRKRIIELGYTCPEVYGDPALLLPLYYPAEVEKKYRVGIVPHYVDYDTVAQWYGAEKEVAVIDLLSDDVFATTDQIVGCDCIVSSSLHGVIVAHAYGIPAVWVRFSDKLSGDNTKYADYFESVHITPYKGKLLMERLNIQELTDLFKAIEILPKSEKISQLQEGLLAAFPEQFKLN